MSMSAMQQEIIETAGNMIVSASAGTGKTHTMVAKIEKELEENHSHKAIAAITFTVKAAKEIRTRLKIDTSEQFIGTNNSFAIAEIIQPFARDVYGNEFRSDISTDYSVKKQSFQECLSYLKNNKTICSYDNNKKNFVFELALEIVKKSSACQLYLKAKYWKIYVDEYQDCDEMMHSFFMYLCQNLGIELFVVGDEKQSIYIWRGAYPEAFRSILKLEGFQKKALRENYRSCPQIQNYSNLLDDSTNDLYKPTDNKSSIIYIKTTSLNWIAAVRPHIDLKKACALLRYKNEQARIGALELTSLGEEFTYIPRTPISDLTTDVSWLYNAIAKYFILQKYSVYDFMDEIPEESIGDRRIKNYLIRKLESISYALDENKDYEIIKEVEDIALYFGYSCNEEHIRNMIKTITCKEFHPAFNVEELTHVAITIHSSKGLEYEQVIVFANDYELNRRDSIYNHYVAVTRAKSKLVIVRITDVDDSKGKMYCRNITEIFKKAGVKPQDVMTFV